jgi:CHAT domain-containing protein
LGLSRKAISLLQQIQQTLLEQPNSHTLVIAERSLGDALLVTGDLKQSRTVLENSLKLAEELQLPQEIAAVNLSLGNLARAEAIDFLSQNNLTVSEVGLQLAPPQDPIEMAFQRRRAKIVRDFYQQTEKALELYDRAISQTTTSNTRISAQLNQLNLLVATQRWQLAQKLYPEIKTQIDRLPSTHRNIYDRLDLAQSLLKLLSQNRELSQEIKQIITTASEQAKKLGDSRAQSYVLVILGNFYEQTQQYSEAKNLTEQALIIAQAINAGDISFRSWWQLGRILEFIGDRSRAIAAYSEAVKTLSNLRNDLVAVNRDIQFSFQETIEPVYRQLVDLLLTKDSNNEPSKESLRQARNIIESLRIAELDNFFQEACLESKFNLERVVEEENLSAALFYTIVLPDRIEVILKLPQQDLLRYATNISQERIKSLLETLVQEVRKPYVSPTMSSLSEQVYNWLIRPAETALKSANIETLVFVQDSTLLNLPISALYDGQQYLIEKYSLALAPGMELSAPQALEKTQLRMLLAGLSEGRNNFSPLTYVEEEVEQIKSTFPSQILFNQTFTKQNFEQEIDSYPFSVVHIATHGQFSSNAEKTFVLAWDNPINVNELGRLLRSRELQRPEPLELLVLSACQTAVGDRRASLGLAGIAVKSGAKSTIASLWNIQDRSASLLMRQFYQELANNNISKAEALRRAQKTLLADPQYESPLFWAPYVLLGNWL